jgi:hypothetical protein
MKSMDSTTCVNDNTSADNFNGAAWQIFNSLKTAFIDDLREKDNDYFAEDDHKAEKLFYNVITGHLEDHSYGRHTKVNQQGLSEEENTFLRFTETMMFLMWSPVGNRPSQKEIVEELKMHRMSNIAKPASIRKFITDMFPKPIMKYWARNQSVTIDHSMSSGMICSRCMMASGLPVVPDSEDDGLVDYRLRQKLMSLLHDIDQVSEFDPTIPKEDLNHMRTMLEFFFQEYLYFLVHIPDINANICSVYNRKIDTFFSSHDRTRKQSYYEFKQKFDKQMLGVVTILLESTSQAMDEGLLQSFKTRIYPKIDWGMSKEIRDVLNPGSHAGTPEEYSITEFKQTFSEYIQGLLDLNLIPKGAVFYRKEQDAFGVHFKGNYLDGEPAVLLDHGLNQDSLDIEIGQFYYIYSGTYPAYLEGYVAPLNIRQ